MQIEEQFESLSITTNLGCGSRNEWSGTATVPSELDLPDGSKYVFGYDSDARLTSVTLPTGATINYSYTIDCSSGATDNGNDALARWDSINGTSHEWSWARSQQGSGAVQTIETDPYGNDGVYNFAAPYWPGESGALTSAALYSGSHSSGTELQAAAITNTLSSNYVSQQVTEITDYLNGSPSRYMETILAPNVWGLPLYEYTYDWSSSCFSCGTFLRNTTISYTSLLGGVTAKPAEITVSPNTGGGGQISQTNFIYDSKGNLLTEHQYVNSTTYLTKTWTYNTNGTVATATDANNGQTTYTYGTGSCGGLFPTTVQSPVTAVYSTATWDCVGGVQLTSADANSQSTTTTTYADPNGIWRPSSITAPDLAVTDLTYTANSVERAMTFNGGNSVDDVLTTVDGLGEPILVQRYQGPSTSKYDTVETEYDAMGRAVGVSQPFSTTAGSTSGSGNFTTTTYDALSRPVTVTDAGGGTLTYSYNDNDVLSTVGPAPTGENTKQKQEQFDALGQLQSVCEITAGTSNWPGASCGQTTAATGYLTTYTRNAVGAITGVTQNAQSSTTESRSFSFDWLGRMTSETNPETGTTNFTFDTDSTCGTSDGDLVKRVDANGTVSCYSYDALHRVTEVSYPTLGTGVAGTPNKYFVYDAATVDSTAMKNVAGKLAEAYTGSHTTDLGFSYPNPTSDEEDVYQSSPTSGGWYVSTLQHYANGSPSTLTLPVGVPAITYGLDYEGRANGVTTSGTPATLVNSTGTTYSADGLTALALGSGDSDAYAYDAATGRMTQYQFTVGGQTDTGALTWNDNGSLAQLAITDNITGTSDTQTCSFTHDDLGRIATANCGSGWNQSFSVDPFGNVGKTASAGTSFSASFNLKNEISSVGGVNGVYDSDGNLLNNPSNNNTQVNDFDADGHATTFNNTTVTYDALGRAAEFTSGSTTYEFVYGPGGAKLAVMNGQSLFLARVPLPSGGNAVYSSGGLQAYDHADWEGSVRLQSAPNQTLFSETAYAPYGENYSRVGNNWLFTGQTAFIDGGSYDFLMREYSPTQSRWWTPDPAGLAAVNPNNPQTWNEYAYVAGTPLEATDPSGLCGNVVIAGSTESPGGPGVAAESGFAGSIGADIAFPFADQGYLGSYESVQAAALGGGAAVGVAMAAIEHTAAMGGPFTVYAFSGGAQAAQSALRLLPASISSRATVVGISPGFGLGPLSVLPRESFTVGGGDGFFDDLVAATAIGNFLNSGPTMATACGHDSNCEFGDSLPYLLSYASPSCSQKNETFSRGSSGGGSQDLLSATAPYFGTLTGSLGDILQLYFNSLFATVTVTPGPMYPCGGKYPACK